MPPKVVIITGASSGIGRCTAALFGRRGWHVGLIARGEPGLRDVAAQLQANGTKAACAEADVAYPAALEDAATALEAQLGPVDVWVNCAGNGSFGRFLDIPADDFRRVTDVTYLGTVNGTRVALKRMMQLDRGRIVNICSAVAYHGMPLLSSYSGAKHAIRGFDQAIRAELAQEGSKVRITTVFPPAVNTPFFDHAVSHMGRPGRPMPPVYQPEIVAEAAFLAAMSGRAEMPVSFTTVLFAIGMRLFPGLVDRAIHKLGYGGQLTSLDSALARYAPTLSAPSDNASPIHGCFTDEARRRSFQIQILCAWRRLNRRIHQHSGVADHAFDK
jgi:short-subunit dehydrogenase